MSIYKFDTASMPFDTTDKKLMFFIVSTAAEVVFVKGYCPVAVYVSPSIAEYWVTHMSNAVILLLNEGVLAIPFPTLNLLLTLEIDQNLRSTEFSLDLERELFTFNQN